MTESEAVGRDDPRSFEVPVPGGHLAVAAWGDAREPVIAVHGITASHRAWSAVAAQRAGGSLVAPDLRGRGDSNALSGPYGMAVHAGDVLRLMDHLGIGRAVAAGHSMGAHVVAELATRAPDRVERLVLIDGGLPPFGPPPSDPDRALEALLGPALDRLRRTFATPAEYLDFWRQHPAFAEPGGWNEYVEAYLDYDLTGAVGELRSKVSEQAVRADGRDLLLGRSQALWRVKCPVALVRAERGLLNQPQPLIPAAAAAAAASRLRSFTHELVPRTNHYTLLLGRDGAEAVARRLWPSGVRRHVVAAVKSALAARRGPK